MFHDDYDDYDEGGEQDLDFDGEDHDDLIVATHYRPGGAGEIGTNYCDLEGDHSEEYEEQFKSSCDVAPITSTDNDQPHHHSVHDLWLQTENEGIIDVGEPTIDSMHDGHYDTVVYNDSNETILYVDDNNDGMVDYISDVRADGTTKSYQLISGQWVEVDQDRK